MFHAKCKTCQAELSAPTEDLLHSLRTTHRLVYGHGWFTLTETGQDKEAEIAHARMCGFCRHFVWGPQEVDAIRKIDSHVSKCHPKMRRRAVKYKYPMSEYKAFMSMTHKEKRTWTKANREDIDYMIVLHPLKKQTPAGKRKWTVPNIKVVTKP